MQERVGTELTLREGNGLVNALESAGFWALPGFDEKTVSKGGSGVSLIEGRRGPGYHSVIRLGETPSIIAIVKLFASLSHLHLDPNWPS